MIYFSADDYGLGGEISARIQTCIDRGALDKVSVFPNFDKVDLQALTKGKNIRLSLHANLVEGKCMGCAEELALIADGEGNFRHTFGGLFLLNIFRAGGLEEQVYRELRAQIRFWKDALPKDAPFCIDSHQHTHMIPAVFRAMMRALRDENIAPSYLRIPAEPLMPYILTPSLYGTYKPVGLIKQWLLKFLWLLNRHRAKRYNIPTAYFLGILFSGSMDEKRVGKILEKYKKRAEKDGSDIEVLFHPGYMDGGATELKHENIVFETFYRSQNRKTEFDSLMKLTERSVQ